MARKRKPLPLLEAIEITGVAAEGNAIARVATGEPDSATGQRRELVVFIPYGAPGDVADLQVDRKKHSFANAHIERLITPSPLRRAPVCEHFGVCGGCRWQHLPYSTQLQFKQQQVTDALTRIAKVELPPVTPIQGSDREFAYRNKMEYTFSNKKWRTWEEVRAGKEFTDSSDALGFHIPGAFDKVLHIRQCHLQEERGNEIRNFIYDYAQRYSLSFYDIRANAGLLRTMMIRIASTGEQMLVMAFGADEPALIKQTMEAIAERFPDISALLYVVNTKLNDSIGDLDVKVWRGLPYIEEELDGLRFRVHAKSFYQTNSAQAAKLYATAARLAFKDVGTDTAPLVYDLYTGTGTIANYVARRAGKVVGIEYVEEAIVDARINSDINGISNTEFFAGDMKDVLTDTFVARHGHPDIIITDPPRAGMHPDVVECIKRTAPSVIVYVSCNPATQARDLALLDCMYRVTDVSPVDMFPQTHHVENVVRLQLRDNSYKDKIYD